MRKKIAIITGASGGIGKEFTRLLIKENIDEVWAIARNQKKLDMLKQELGDKVVPISRDLSKASEIGELEKKLKKVHPIVVCLINNAGIAKFGTYQEFTAEEAAHTIDVNCKAVVQLCNLCIPYMKRGSRVINVASAASFQPLPYLNLYAASKAFVRSYSRALNVELRGTGVTATAVCPGWVDTELLVKAANGKPMKFYGVAAPKRVAEKAWLDAKRGKDMSVCTSYMKLEHVLTKLVPQKFVMHVWRCRIRKYF